MFKCLKYQKRHNALHLSDGKITTDSTNEGYLLDYYYFTNIYIVHNIPIKNGKWYKARWKKFIKGDLRTSRYPSVYVNTHFITPKCHLFTQNNTTTTKKFHTQLPVPFSYIMCLDTIITIDNSNIETFPGSFNTRTKSIQGCAFDKDPKRVDNEILSQFTSLSLL